MMIFKKEEFKECLSKLFSFLRATWQKVKSKKFVVEALSILFCLVLAYCILWIFIPSLPMHKVLAKHQALVIFSSYFILLVFIPSLLMPKTLAKYYSSISKKLKDCGRYIRQKRSFEKNVFSYLIWLSLLGLGCFTYFAKISHSEIEARYIGAGIIALLGILVAARRSLAAEEQNAEQRKSRESAVRPGRDRRFSEAISNLEATKENKPHIAKRRATLYSLEELMKEAPDSYHKSSLNELCQYLRDNAKEEDGKEVRSDVQLCLKIISSRKVRPDEDRLDLARIYISGYNLESANIEKAYLLLANLERADLSGANLKEANLYEANLDGAYLNSASLVRANLWGANLERATLLGANFNGANLREANLERANLNGANLKEAFLWKANLEETDLWKANLKGAYLGGAKSLKKSQLSLAKEVKGLILPNLDWLKDMEQLDNYNDDLNPIADYKAPPCPSDHQYARRIIRMNKLEK